MMTRFSTNTFLLAAALSVLTTSAFAQAAAPTPWVLSPDMGYGYGKDGKTYSYKMGTNNAGLLLKGAKKVPKGTLFFIGQNGQLICGPGPSLKATASSCSDRAEQQCSTRADDLKRRCEVPGALQTAVAVIRLSVTSSSFATVLWRIATGLRS